MIYLIAFLFVLAMVYLTKFRKVIFVAAGIAAAAVVIIAAMLEVHERQSDGVPPLPAGYTLVPQKQSYERTSCCYRGYDLSKFSGAERRRLRMLLIKPQLISARFPMPN